ncbi:uncharacterized protein [Anas acuta]|uniref:uncharacterized protein isoform X1 n=1 Tax=Anas acuta TaxID=28680 RepID=UPI0035C8C846
MLQLLEGRTLSLAALELAGKLPALFGDDSSTVRLLSIRLFLDTLGFVEGSQEKLQQVAHRSLLPLSFHLHDQDESVAEASREALLGVARFLRWRQLAHLAETLQSWKIGECLVRTVLHPGPGPGPGPGPPCAEPVPFPLQLARRSSAAEEYLAQSLPYLQSLQEPLRREAVRFTGEPRAWGPPSLCLRAAPRGAAGGADRPCVPRARGEAPAGSAPEQEPGHLPSPARLGKRPLRVGLVAGDSDGADPASTKATLTLQLSAAVLQAAEGVEEATLFPGRQLSVLESSRHLLLPAAQPRSPGTFPPLLRPSACRGHARSSSRSP